jgi:hypothetical protein
MRFRIAGVCCRLWRHWNDWILNISWRLDDFFQWGRRVVACRAGAVWWRSGRFE